MKKNILFKDDSQKTSQKSIALQKKILKERAKALAKEIVNVEENTEKLEVLSFSIGSEQYGIESLFVNKVHLLRDLTPLPGVAAFIIGIINVRGKIAPVIDIKKFFDLPDKAITPLNKVIIIEAEEAFFGILADEVTGISHIPTHEIQASLPTLTGIRAEYLKGVTINQLVILDPIKLALDKKILIDDKV